MAFVRIRKRLRQRRWRLLFSVRLLMVCLAATAVVLLWELHDLSIAQRAMPAVATEVATIAAERKFEDRTATAIIGEALSRRGDDLSQLPVFELGPHYISLDGTTLLQGDRQIRFHGVEGPRATEVCLDDHGRRWACGLQARAALHNLLAGGSLLCTPRMALGDGGMSASCSLRKASAGGPVQDVARSLVALGWARPAPATKRDLDEALAAARRDQAGLWRGDWTLSPTTIPPL